MWWLWYTVWHILSCVFFFWHYKQIGGAVQITGVGASGKFTRVLFRGNTATGNSDNVSNLLSFAISHYLLLLTHNSIYIQKHSFSLPEYFWHSFCILWLVSLFLFWSNEQEGGAVWIGGNTAASGTFISCSWYDNTAPSNVVSNYKSSFHLHSKFHS